MTKIYNASPAKETDGEEKKGKASGAKPLSVKVKKYFAKLHTLSPIAKLNNRAVALALEGNFNQAEILFREVLEEDDNESALYNNIAIVYEFLGEKDRAFAMYSKACILAPDNAYFKRNFQGFKDVSK